MKFENTEVFNIHNAIRGMRNPLESWHLSDTLQCSRAGIMQHFSTIGDKDLELAQKLIRAGTDHSKFMRQIFVSVDITAPIYWWKEFDTYKIGTTANSTSTMHTITKKPITTECFDFKFPSSDKVDKTILDLIKTLEELRLKYLETKDKKYWKLLIQLLPQSWLQLRTVSLSFQNLRAIRSARKNHKLTEWSIDTMKWIESIPYSEQLILFDEKK